MGSVCAWMARTDARERIREQSVTMIGPSVYLVRLLGTMVLRNVGTVIVVPVGCFSDLDAWDFRNLDRSSGRQFRFGHRSA